MFKKTVYFVKFWAPGTFVGEQWTADIDSPDPAAIKWPENAYAFTLHKRTDAHDDGEVFKGVSRQVGPMYYHPDSKVETQAQVATNPNAGPCLLSNMKINQWDRVIWTRWGNWPQPYSEKEATILPPTNGKG